MNVTPAVQPGVFLRYDPPQRAAHGFAIDTASDPLGQILVCAATMRSCEFAHALTLLGLAAATALTPPVNVVPSRKVRR